MKRIITCMLSAVIVLSGFAAEKESPEQVAKKDYSTWLPAKGDWSIGIGLNPITTFIGNLFNAATTNNLGALAGEPMGTAGVPVTSTTMPTPFVSIMGGYMMTDSWELHANAGFGFVYNNANFYAKDDEALFLDPLSDATVIDNHKTEHYSGSIALGAHYHLGKNHRVQGVFGAGVLYAFGQNKDSYKYGNQIGELNQNPTIATGMGVTYNTALVGYIPFARTLNSTAAAMHRVGAYGTVGVEIFLAPKISLGANINVYLFYDFTPAVENLYEGWNIRTDDLSLYRQKVSPAQHGVTFSTNNIGANLYLSFYL